MRSMTGYLKAGQIITGLAALVLVSTTAFAQPSPDMGPGPDQQGAPMEGTPTPGGPMQGGPMQDQGGPMQQGAQMQRPPHMTMAQKFDAANVTHDGRLTREQAQGGRMGMIVRNFDQIDVDHKGYVTVQDIRAWHRAMHQARATQGGPPPGAPGQMAPQMAPQQ